MDKRHVSTLVAATAVIALALTGCASGASGGTTSGAKSIKIAGVYENTQDAFWGTVVCGARGEAKKLGVDMTFTTLPTQDEAKLSTALDTALLAKPNGLIFDPINTTSWAAKLTAIAKQGIAITTQTTDFKDIEWQSVQSFPKGDDFAPDVVKIVGEEKGSAVILNGLASAPFQSQRLDGIVAAVKTANPALTFLPNQIDGFDVNKGTQIMTSLIAAHPELKLILAPAGPEGQAAAAAVKQTGNSGKIHIISFDAVPAELEAVRDGTIDMLIAQPALTIGQTQVSEIVKFLNSSDYKAGKPVTPTGKAKVLPLGKITKENIDDPSTKAFQYNPSC